MYGMTRGRVSASGAPEAPGTLAGNRVAGLVGGSGMVPDGSPIITDPNSGGRVDDLGRHVVQTNPQPTTDLLKIPGVETRPMLGGLRTAHHTGLLKDSPAFDGRHVELVNRRSVVVLAPHEQQLPAPADALPSLRVPPTSDPYGRMCNNAAAAREASAR